MNAIVDMTSDATVTEEKLSFRSGYQQQMSKDPMQEFQLAKHSQCVIPMQKHVNITGDVGVASTLDNTSHGERPNRYTYCTSIMCIVLIYIELLMYVCT